MKKTNIFYSFLIIIFVFQNITFAQYSIPSNVFASSNGYLSNSSFNLKGTLGQPFTGVYVSSSYGLSSGFWYSYDIITEVELDKNNLPTEFKLFYNYPNPFNPSTTITYQIPKLSFVSLKVYDILGREVVALVNEEKPIGNYKVNFNASGLSSGIYFYRLVAGSFVETNLGSNLAGILGPLASLENDGEFVTSKASDGIRFSQAGNEP